MTYYISLNVKLSNSQLNKLKSVIKKTKVVLRLSNSRLSNITGNSDDETINLFITIYY